MTTSRRLSLRLYIAGDGPHSTRAVGNLKALGRAHPGRYDLEIVDVLRTPERALADGVFITPMLVRLSPRPVRRIAGDLSRGDAVLRDLGLEQ